MDKQLPNEHSCKRGIEQLISQALDGLKPNPCFIGNEAHEVMQRAYNGDVEAMTVLFSYIAMYAKPSEMLPEEFLLYFHWKALQLDKHKSIKVLGQAKYRKKTGKVSTHLDLVKMVLYLTTRCQNKYELDDAFFKVAEDVCQELESVKEAYKQWPPKQRSTEKPAPYIYVQNLGGLHHIGSDEEYELARQNVLKVESKLFRPVEIMSSAIR
jgi:hypothetical protein